MNADPLNFLRTLQGPVAEMQRFAETLKSADEATCSAVVSAISKVIKGDERPYAKLRALQVLLT